MNAVERAVSVLDAGAGERVVVAVSGGPDSVALLAAAQRVLTRRGVDVRAAHFNHGIRAEAGEDEALVARLCGELGVTLCVGRADVPALAAERKQGLETCAREERLAFLERTCAALGAKACLTAHHADDQAETVLMRLFRGAGAPGLRGIPRKRGVFVRPLLDLRKEETVAYCAENSLMYALDATNRHSDTPRNWLRNEILPLVRARYPAAERHIVEAADALNEDDDALAAIASRVFEEALDKGALCLSPLRAQPPAVRKRVLGRWLKGIGGSPERTHLCALDNWLSSGRTSGEMHMPGAVIELSMGVMQNRPVVTQRGVVAFTKDKPVHLGGWRLSLVESISRASLTTTAFGEALIQAVDTRALPDGLTVRFRENGDRMRPYGAPGERLVSDVFADKKIPRAQRDDRPVLALNARVLWIPGVAVDECLAVKDGEAQIAWLKLIHTNAMEDDI